MPATSHAIAGSNGLNIEELAASLKQLVEQEPAFGAYHDFLDKAHKLEKAVPDEAQRFAAALDLTGTSLDALLASVRAYAAVVERENGRFEAHFAGAAQQAIDDLKSQDAALQQEIDTLSQRLAEANARKADNTRAITEHTSSLAKARIDFDAARSTVAQYYEGVAHKLQTNLGATHGQ